MLKLNPKMLFLIVSMVIPMVFGITGISQAGHEPPGPGEILEGPPVVGQAVLDVVSIDCPYGDAGPCLVVVDVDFDGCCANCFDKCKSSCNAHFDFSSYTIPNVIDTNGDDQVTLEDLLAEDFQWLRMNGRGPQNCYSLHGGETMIIQNVFGVIPENMDNDDDMELKVNVGMLFIGSAP